MISASYTIIAILVTCIINTAGVVNYREGVNIQYNSFENLAINDSIIIV